MNENQYYIKNNIMKKLICLFFFSLYLILPDAMSQTAKEALEQQKKRLESEIQYTQKLLDQNRKDKVSNENQVNLLNKQISSQQNLIALVNQEVNQINIEIRRTEKELTELEDEIKKLKEEYAKMIYYSYLTRNTYHRLMFIFASENMNEAFLRLRYLQEYASSRRRQADLINEKQLELNRKVESLKSIQKQKFELLKEQERKNNELQQQRREKDKTVRDLQTREKQLRADIRKKQENANKLQREIEAIIRREIEEAKKKADAKKVAGSNMSLTPAEFEISKGFAGNKGSIPWPVENGVITGRFGEFPHPVLPGIKIKNNGVDISTSKGADVKVVFEGTVSAVINLPNGSQAVIVRHGEYLTVYANLYAVQVKKGDKLRVNQLLGKVQTDSSNATIFHFEVWKETTIENPETWIKRK
jgi:septal ring factor EnvC (AmiA/AmiB activator)